ncbi:MAG TPA: transposase [Candidatus Aphodousia faecipullorum]|nr:transposase [Candidatus Aphodousia faecipullorum]
MKQFSQEFKNSVIERIRNGETQMGVAKSLGISSKTVNSWWMKAKEELPQEQLSAEQEIARLKKLLREREAEIDFLKKATAYFAKMP